MSTDLSIDGELRQLRQRAEGAAGHRAEGAELELPSLGIGVSLEVQGEDYLLTIWSTAGRHAAEEAPVRRVLAALFTEAAPTAHEMAGDGYDRVFRIARSAVPPHPEVLSEPAGSAGPGPGGVTEPPSAGRVDEASEQSFPASDPPAY